MGERDANHEYFSVPCRPVTHEICILGFTGEPDARNPRRPARRCAHDQRCGARGAEHAEAVGAQDISAEGKCDKGLKPETVVYVVVWFSFFQACSCFLRQLGNVISNKPRRMIACPTCSASGILLLGSFTRY